MLSTVTYFRFCIYDLENNVLDSGYDGHGPPSLGFLLDYMVSTVTFKTFS